MKPIKKLPYALHKSKLIEMEKKKQWNLILTHIKYSRIFCALFGEQIFTC